ncbi:nuclear transport factor 2 family protein [Actinokineospora inagensis]|uniref:nuclear transport factor 2 family protein n=1 Tax=Actinokineospora inagensis TaxID=103730 RepID=UPI0003F9FD9B|nr:nuclear transport factor 2 family protein [Actinokineospora inagensis]
MTEINTLIQRWATAEAAGDLPALQEITTPDFTAVGPVGFVLSRDQWLDRYRTGALRTDSITVDDLAVRDHGDTAVAIGRHTMTLAYQGNPTSGEFRVTHLLHRDGHRWRLAGQHLSQIRVPDRARAAQP